MRAYRPQFVLSVAALLLLALAGSAAAEKKRVGVPRFEGPQEAVVRKRVMQVLKGEGYELVKSRELEAAAQSAGASLDSNDGFRAVAKELSISSFVTGEVSKKKAKLTVRNGADGSVSGEGSFSGANPRKVAAEVGKAFMRRLGSAVDRGKVPSGAKKPQKGAVAESPEDNEDAPEAGGGDDDDDEKKKSGGEKVAAADSGDKESDNGESASASRKKRKKKDADAEEKKEEEAEDEGPSGPLLPWLDLAVGPRVFSRNLTYNQDVNRALRQYKLGAGPAVVLSAAFYPGAFVSSGLAGNIGLALDVEQAFGVTSKVGATDRFPNGAEFPTVIHDYAAAVRWRLALGGGQIGIQLGGGEHAFSFRSGTGVMRTDLDIPDTIYRYVRPGVDARFEVANGIAVRAGLGYRHILNGGGQIKDQYFSHLTVAGLDAMLGVTYAVTPMIEVRVSGELRRYWYDMHSVAGDPLIAGGAVDQYLSGTAMVAFFFGGDETAGASGGGGGEETPPPAAKKKPPKEDEGGGGGGDAE